MTNGHNHPPRCCCTYPPSSLIGTAQPEHHCPACPEHGDLASLDSSAAALAARRCISCHAPDDQPHTDYCQLATPTYQGPWIDDGCRCDCLD